MSLQNYNIGIDIDNTLTNESPFSSTSEDIIVSLIKKSTLKKGIEVIKNKDFNIFIITGRTEKYRKITIEWLYKNDISFNQLIMPPDTYYPDNIFNFNLYLKFKLQSCIDNKIHLMLDDNEEVVNLLNLYNFSAQKVNGNLTEAFNKLIGVIK